VHNYVTVSKFEQPSLFVVVLRLATILCPNMDGEAPKDEFDDLQLLENDAVTTRVDHHQRRQDHIWWDDLAIRTAVVGVGFHP